MSQHDTLTARLDRIASWLRNPANTDGCEALELSFAEWCKTVEEAIAALSATQPAQAAQSETALQKFARFKVDETDGGPVEKLHAFCAFAMNSQDWLDVEPFFDRIREAQAAQGAGEVLALPLFDELDDEAIDEACAAGAIYRVDFARAWNALRDWRPYYSTSSPAQTAPVVHDGWRRAMRTAEGALTISICHAGMQPAQILSEQRKALALVKEALAIAVQAVATPTPPAQAAQQGEKA